ATSTDTIRTDTSGSLPTGTGAVPLGFLLGTPSGADVARPTAASADTIRVDTPGNPPAGTAGVPLGFLLGTPSGADVARTLSRTHSAFLRGGPDWSRADVRDGTEPAASSARRLAFLLDQAQRDTPGERDALAESTPRGRDTAGLLP